MDSIFPYLIITALLVILYLREDQNKKERKDLLRMIKARDLDEVVRAEIQDKHTPEEPTEPEYRPTEELTDEEFFNAVTKEATK